MKKIQFENLIKEEISTLYKNQFSSEEINKLTENISTTISKLFPKRGDEEDKKQLDELIYNYFSDSVTKIAGLVNAINTKQEQLGMPKTNFDELVQMVMRNIKQKADQEEISQLSECFKIKKQS